MTTKTETVSTNIPVPIARNKQDQTTDMMIRRGNGIIEGKYDIQVQLNVLLNSEETKRSIK